jgi:hypothetical protein
MNQELLRLARARNSSLFISTYLSLNPGHTNTQASSAYNGYLSQIAGGNGGGTGGGYTPPPANNNGGAGVGGGGWLTTIGSTLNDGFKGIVGLTEKFYRTQFGQNKELGGPDNNVGQKILDLLQSGGFNPLKLIGGGFVEIENEILDQLTRESQLKSEINSKSTLTLELSKDLREDILESSINASKFGFTLNQLGELYTGLAEKSGRYALINKETMDLAAPVAATLSMSMEQLSDTINEFEKVGKGANDTLETIFEVEKRSMVLGLNGKKIVADLQTNIGKLNEYGFKKGVEGLAEMTRKAVEFRMSMEESFKIADKVMNPEGALELTANLQVLGGAIGDFNDPLKLMYMATNNVEGLQDALIDASKSLATYNEEQGRFEITGINLRRAKEMATQLGVSYQELAKGSIAAAERSNAATSLMMSGLQMKDDDKELLLNLSRMEKGEMVIKIPQTIASRFEGKTEVRLDQMTEGLKKELIANAEAIKGMKPEDMAMAQLTETQKMAMYLESIAAWGKRRGVQIFRGALEGSGLQGKMQDKYSDIIKYSNEIKPTIKDVNFQQNIKVKTEEGIDNLKKIPERLKQKGKKILNDAGDWIEDNLGIGKVDVKHTHEHIFRTPNLVDNISREMIKGNMMMTEEPNPRGYLGKNKMNNNYV